MGKKYTLRGSVNDDAGRPLLADFHVLLMAVSRPPSPPQPTFVAHFSPCNLPFLLQFAARAMLGGAGESGTNAVCIVHLWEEACARGGRGGEGGEGIPRLLRAAPSWLGTWS